jgi:biopolymer transport protein ExbD
MRNHPRTSEHVNPNLIPMIDIMFLLLLFFMLGADMGHRELETVRLPEASTAIRDHPEQQRERRLTINANHKEQVTCADYRTKRICRDEAHWEIAFRGKNCTEPSVLAKALSDTQAAELGPLAERRVMIRADAGAPFGLAQRAMNVCAQLGIFKIEVGAAKPQAH